MQKRPPIIQKAQPPQPVRESPLPQEENHVNEKHIENPVFTESKQSQKSTKSNSVPVAPSKSKSRDPDYLNKPSPQPDILID